MKKTIAIIATLTVGIATTVAVYAYRGMMSRSPEVVLPEFTELPSGPRAPESQAFGHQIGESTFASVSDWGKSRGLTCRDTSARELMKHMRKKKKEEAEAKAEKEGKEVDAVSSASAYKTSPMEKNPQIRWSCENTKADQIADRDRTEANGRLLFVFDSPEHPLRHASFRRRHRAVDVALKDLKTSYANLVTRYGPPTESNRPLPTGEEDDPLPQYTPFTYEWQYADLKVVLKLIAYPRRRGIDLQEAVEVPWPVRPDAPTLPKTPMAEAQASN